MTVTELQNKTKELRAKIELASAQMSDETALTTIELFPKWETNTRYIINIRVQYNNVLYRCVQEHTSQSDWTPDITPALWTVVSVEEYPEWVQPTGTQDAYQTGDKVTYNNKHYISTIDNNVWSPDTYPDGWQEVE